jgi:hypothetical protein
MDLIYESEEKRKLAEEFDKRQAELIKQEMKQSKVLMKKFKVKEKFSELNKKYFKGKLSLAALQVLPMSFEGSGQTFFGMIKLNSSLFTENSNLSSKCLWHDILLHEMIHYCIDETPILKKMQGQENPHLNKAWKTEVKRISKLLKVEFKESKSYLETFPVKARPKNYYEDGIKLISKKKVSK